MLSVENMGFGDYLREQRIKAKLRQQEFADKVGVSRGFISQLETEISSPSADTVLNITKVLRQHGVYVTDAEVFKEAGITAVKDLPKSAPDPVSDIATSLLNRLTEEWQRAQQPGVSDPPPSDRLEDERHRPVSLSVFIATLSRIGRIVSLDTLPLANASLPCSLPLYREGETLEDFTFLSEAEGVFGVIVEGDSMIPYYHQGDCVIARPFDGEYEKDRHYIVLIEGKVTCKALEDWGVERDRLMFTFAPANSKYPRIRASQDDVIFQGTVIASLPKSEIARARRSAEEKRGG